MSSGSENGFIFESCPILNLNDYKPLLHGMVPLLQIGLSYAETLQWDQWIRRRVRLCHWKDWKVPRTRRRKLINLGIPSDKVKLASRSRKGYWRMALNDQYLKELGVPSMRNMWVVLKYADKAKI